MKINFKKLIGIVLITILVGSFFSFFTGTDIYNKIERPFLSPPGIVFPIIWFVIYTLMGISLYIVLEENSLESDSALLIYIIQLIVNTVVKIIGLHILIVI